MHYLHTLNNTEQLSNKCESWPVFFFKLIMRSLHHHNILRASLMATHIPLDTRHVPDSLLMQISYSYLASLLRPSRRRKASRHSKMIHSSYALTVLPQASIRFRPWQKKPPQRFRFDDKDVKPSEILLVGI